MIIQEALSGDSIKTCSQDLAQWIPTIPKVYKSFEFKPLSQLSLEKLNSNVLLKLNIIGSVDHGMTIPITLLAVDVEGQVCVMSVYNVKANLLGKGTRLTISSPNYMNVQVKHPKVNSNFSRIIRL